MVRYCKALNYRTRRYVPRILHSRMCAITQTTMPKIFELQLLSGKCQVCCMDNIPFIYTLTPLRNKKDGKVYSCVELCKYESESTR